MSSNIPFSIKAFSTPLPPSLQSQAVRTIGPTSSPYAFLNPSRIPNCQIWFDAADTATITGTSTVTAWRSKGSLNIVASNNTGSCSSGNLLTNGLNYIRCPTGTMLSFQTALTSQARSFIFVVRNLTQLTESPKNFWGPLNQTAGNGQMAVVFDLDAGTGLYQGSIGASGFETGGIIANGFSNPFEQVNIYGFINSATSTSLNVMTENGTPQNKTVDYVAAFYNTNFITYTINTVFYNTGCDVMEMIYYGRDINQQERQNLEGYLAWKWGLTSKLPNNHPFKGYPPGLNIPPSIYIRPFFNRSFSPLNIANAVLWLDGADSSTVTVSDGNVTGWNDKSGLGNNTTSVSTTGPTYVSNGVVFSSPNTTFLRGALNLTFVNTATTFVVTMPTSNASAIFLPRMFSLANTSGSTDVFFAPQANFIFGNSTLTPQLVTYLNTNTNPTGLDINVQTALPTTSGTRVLYTNNSSYDGTTFTINTFLNGATSSNSSRTGSFTATANYVNTYDRYVLGGNPFSQAGSGDSYNGTIYEVLIFTSRLTLAQQQNVEGYLAWKWGLQTNLPAGHPFRLCPPPPT